MILKPCCIGDVLLSTPLVAAIRQGYPNATITYAVGVWSRPMIQTSPHIDDILTIPESWSPSSFLAVARELRQRRFDCVFVPGRSPLLGLLTLAARIPVRIGLDSRGRGFAYSHPVPVPQTVMHEADLYLLLAQAVGLPAGERRLWFFPTEAERAEAAKIVDTDGDGPLVILHPGGGSNPGMVLQRKRWLPERWAEVADRLHHEHSARILIVGSAAEQAVVETVQRAMRAPVAVLPQQWQWGVLGAAIQGAALFLGHDTGMSLLANAVGTPHVVVFGPSDPQTYGPYGATGRYVWRPTPESPCFYDGSASDDCPCMSQCMRNVEMEHVLNVVDKLWDVARPKQPF